MRKISIIIPIYNVEKYLSGCIDSIINQTYNDLEIILVNDGSTDSCPQICDKYAAKDNRIKVIHKKNGGLSDARNAGYGLVTGDYLSFVDNDDILSPNFYHIMLQNLINNNADIVECNFLKFKEKDEIKNVSYDSNTDVEVYNAQMALELLMKQDLKQVVWNKLYRIEIVKGFFFEKGKMNEDEFWTYKIFGNAKKIIKIPNILYFYRQQPESLMGKGYNLKRLDGLDALQERINYMADNFPSLVGLSALRFFDASVYHFLNLTMKSDLDKDNKYRKKIIERLKPIYRFKMYKSWKIKKIIWFFFFLMFPKLGIVFRKKYLEGFFLNQK